MDIQNRAAEPRYTIRGMREDEIRLRVGGEVTVELLSGALAEFTRALDAVEASHGANVRWVVAGLDHGSATTLARAVPTDDRSEALISRMCISLVEAGQAVMKGEADVALPVTRHLTKLRELASGDRPVAIECVSGAVEFISGESAEQSGAEMDRFVSLGTIRGRVEMLSHRRRLHFSLYDLVNDSAVACFPAEDMEPRMRDVWGHLADVTGTVRRDPATDRPRSIRDVTSVELVDESLGPDYRSARGVLQTREPAEELIRRMRDAQ